MSIKKVEPHITADKLPKSTSSRTQTSELVEDKTESEPNSLGRDLASSMLVPVSSSSDTAFRDPFMSVDALDYSKLGKPPDPLESSELAGHEKIVVVDQKGKVSYKYMKLENVKRLRDLGYDLLINYPEYLNAENRENLQNFVFGRYYFNDSNPDHLYPLVQSIVTRNIPGLYPERFDTKTDKGEYFSATDYTLLNGASADKLQNFMANRRTKVRQRGFAGKGSFRIPNADHKTILEFANRVFDDGKLNMHFIRSLQFKAYWDTRAKKENQIPYQDFYPPLISFLHNRLEGHIPRQTSYLNNFSGSQEEKDDLVKKLASTKTVWQPDYSPADRLEIAKRYFELYQERLIPRRKEQFERMKYVFSELGKNHENILRSDILNAYFEAINADQLGKIPVAILIDPQYEEQSREYMALLEAYFDREVAKDPQAILLPVANDQEFVSRFEIPKTILGLPNVMDLVNKKRLPVIQRMNDEDFASIFSSVNVGPYGRRHHALDRVFEHENGGKVNRLIRKRLNDLAI